ncbi:MFS transporter permease [Tamilnaduibacter salinus]|uniref:MFS transporter permease n=1 Tax=Tamilnaduibacter salinus TaxID=1484056 RepID=A0A2A2I401_9GAMM|nr:DUF6064 family protein [Tamilnaduibacter salinus]PAV25830.1 MFS transporter permease [Tamilnaduibacter salinus]
MGDLDSYRPSDFLMFSGRVYWRLIERYNEALWPAQILGLFIGLGIMLALIRPSRASRNAVYWGLALAWVGVALSFLRNGYAPINWTVDYLTPLFLAQAGLLALTGRHGAQSPATRTWPGRIGLTLVLAALLLPPVITTISGRGMAATDWFPFFPDALALATLGVLSAAGPAPGIT